MNNLKYLLFIFLKINIIIGLVKSNLNDSNNDNEPVTLIINPYVINNQYVKGDFCGNSTFTCNSMGDAIAFFETIKINVNPTSNSIYQSLNLKIQDSVSGISENVIQVYEYNLTISPFVDGSTGVIFDGNLDSLKSPLINVITSPENSESKQQSLITVTGITFRNFIQPVLKVALSTQSSTIVFNNCNFINFDGSLTNLPLFDSESYLLNPNGSNPSTYLEISNSQILNSTLSNESVLMNLVNSFLNLNNLQVSNIDGGGSNIVFQGTASVFSISNCQFSLIKSGNSIFNCVDSLFSAFSSSFIDSTGTFIYYTTSAIDQYIIELKNCTFINNVALNNGGVIYAINNNQIEQSLASTIDSTTFNNNSVTIGNGGVIYSSNVPFTIVNSNFEMNRAGSNGKGGIFYILYNRLSVSNSTLSTQSSNSELISHTPSISISNIKNNNGGSGSSSSSGSGNLNNQNGEIIFFNRSLVVMQYNNFQGNSVNGSIVCVYSNLQLYSNENLSSNDGSQVYCNFCIANLNSNLICGSTSSTTTDDSSSFTTTTSHTTGNGQSIIHQQYHQLSLSLIIITLLLITLF